MGADKTNLVRYMKKVERLNQKEQAKQFKVFLDLAFVDCKNCRKSNSNPSCSQCRFGIKMDAIKLLTSSRNDFGVEESLEEAYKVSDRALRKHNKEHDDRYKTGSLNIGKGYEAY